MIKGPVLFIMLYTEQPGPKAAFRSILRSIFLTVKIKFSYCCILLWKFRLQFKQLCAKLHFKSYVYWIVHHLDSLIKIDQLITLALLFAQHVSYASTFIFRSLCRLQQCCSLHKDTTSPQPNHTVKPTHNEPEQYTHTQSQAPEDECTSIRNTLSKK